MWLLHKNFLYIVFVVASLTIVNSCGFTPVYSSKNKEKIAVGIEIIVTKSLVVDDATIGDAISRQFKHNLEDLLYQNNLPEKPEYRLNVTITTSSGAMGVARDGSVLRYNMLFDSQYILTRISDGKIIKSDSVKHVGSYNNRTSGAYYSTYIAQKDAVKRGITELSELYRQRLNSIFFEKS